VPVSEASSLAGSDHFEGLMPWEVSMTSTTFHEAFLGPSDLALARRVLDRICAEQTIEIGSREADELAANLIRQLQRGTRDEERLMTLFGMAGQRRRIRSPRGEAALHAVR
jgi:hypothetical protein